MNELDELKRIIDNVHVYRIATALRGIDVIDTPFSKSLKRIFTARIRYIVGVNDDFVIIRKDRIIPLYYIVELILTLQPPYVDKYGNAIIHYIDHVKEALASLRLFVDDDSDLSRELKFLYEFTRIIEIYINFMHIEEWNIKFMDELVELLQKYEDYIDWGDI